MKYLLSLFLLLCSTATCAESIGTSLYVINKVVAFKSKMERSIMRGSPIYVGDEIVTDLNSRTQIKFANGTLVSIAQNTRFQTNTYDPNNDPAIKMGMNHGTIEYNSNSKLKKRGELKTPVVTLAISGTNFQVHVTPNSTELIVRSGEVCGNGVCLGSGHSTNSGEFMNGRVFKAKEVQWVDFAGENASAEQLNTVAYQVADLTQTVELANALTTLNALPSLPFELADVTLTCPP